MECPCVLSPGQLHGSETANKAGCGNNDECWWDIHMIVCVDRIEIEVTAREENPCSRGTLGRCLNRDDPGAKPAGRGVGVRQR
jgi:hypothetical protein